MSDVQTMDVFVSADGGDTWRRYQVVASSSEVALKRVREIAPDLIANEDALYFATGALKAKKFKKEMIASFDVVPVELGVPDQAKEPANG